MTPAARAAAAIDILDAWEAGEQRAEKVLRDWGRANRYAGSKDRRAIGDLVYTCIRRRRSLLTTHSAIGGRGLILGLVQSEGADPREVFSGAKYAPPPLSETELSPPVQPVDDPMRFDHQDWMEAPLKASLGAGYAEAMTSLQTRAPIGLRVNRLKATVDEAAALLSEDGVETISSDLDPDALIAPPGARVAASEAYLSGLVELQDPASQAAARLPKATAGETVLDYCAGGGGKTLALAAHMGGQGRLIAHDVATDRLKQVETRAARAGANIDCRGPDELAEFEGACDLVFVDAPCSGSGSWRRDPEGKWRLTSEDFAEYQTLQREVFANALRYVAPGGRLAYATCSLFEEENAALTDWATNRFADLRAGATLMLSPAELQDGFYCQVFHV